MCWSVTYLAFEYMCVTKKISLVQTFFKLRVDSFAAYVYSHRIYRLVFLLQAEKK